MRDSSSPKLMMMAARAAAGHAEDDLSPGNHDAHGGMGTLVGKRTEWTRDAEGQDSSVEDNTDLPGQQSAPHRTEQIKVDCDTVRSCLIRPRRQVCRAIETSCVSVSGHSQSRTANG